MPKRNSQNYQKSFELVFDRLMLDTAKLWVFVSKIRVEPRYEWEGKRLSLRLEVSFP